LWMVGDNECEMGEPMTPATLVVPVGEGDTAQPQ